MYENDITIISFEVCILLVLFYKNVEFSNWELELANLCNYAYMLKKSIKAISIISNTGDYLLLDE